MLSLSQKMNAQQFIKLVRTNRRAIKKSTFVMPKLGERGYGYFKVEYNVTKLHHGQFVKTK